MAERPDIFTRQRLAPGQLRAVADRRFDDAQALCDTGENARANGAQYLAGIVIEILLKAQLAHHYEAIASQPSHIVTDADRQIWNLIWRSHDLSDMLERLPGLKASILAREIAAGKPYTAWLASICSTWTIFARYSTLTSTISEAREMLGRIKELKEVLR